MRWILWFTLIWSSLASAAKTQRFYFKGEGDQPPAMLVRFPREDSKSLLSAFGEERVGVAMRDSRNGTVGYWVPMTQEALPEFLKTQLGNATNLPPFDDKVVFVSDNLSGRPYFGVSCDGDQCSAWFFLWPNNDVNLPWDKLIKINDGIPGAGKFVQLDIMDPGDAKPTYFRLNSAEEQKTQQKGKEVETFLFRSFVSNDGDFAFDCAQRTVPREAYFCSAQASLLDVVTIDSENARYPLAQRAMDRFLTAISLRKVVKATILGEFKSQLAELDRLVAESRNPKPPVRNGLTVTDQMVAHFLANRPFSPNGDPAAAGGVAVLRAIGDEALWDIVQAVQRSRPYFEHQR